MRWSSQQNPILSYNSVIVLRSARFTSNKSGAADDVADCCHHCELRFDEELEQGERKTEKTTTKKVLSVFIQLGHGKKKFKFNSLS